MQDTLSNYLSTVSRGTIISNLLFADDIDILAGSETEPQTLQYFIKEC